MALDTYVGLKTSIANFLGRSDLTSVIPDFVTLAHKQITRELRGHLRAQTRSTSFSITGEYVAAPADFLELVSLRITSATPDYSLALLDNDTGTDMYGGIAGAPRFVTMTGATGSNTEYFRFSPPPDATYTATLEYYASLPFFSTDGATNWILTDHPDVYLYGALTQATAYIADDPRAAQWRDAFMVALESLKRSGRKARWGGNGMMVRVA